MLREARPPARSLPPMLASHDLASDGPSASLRIAQTSAELAAAVLDGASATQISKRFGDLTGCRVALLGADLSKPDGDSGSDDATPPSRDVSQMLATIARRGEVVAIGPTPGWSSGRTFVAPLRASNQLLGFLVMYERPGRPNDHDLAVSSLQHVAALCVIAMVRERRRSDLVNELRYDLVAGLLLRHRAARGDRARWSEMLELAIGSSYRVLVADVDGATGDPSVDTLNVHVLEALAHEICSRSPRSISVLRGGELLSLIPDPDPRQEQRTSSASFVAKESVNRVRTLFPSVELGAGLGRARPAPTGLAESGLEARNALMVQRRFSPTMGLLLFEELGVYSLLYQVSDTTELKAFVDRVLGRLIAYDHKRHADLLRTLRAILDHNGSLLNAARDIGVHVNTIAYRHDRIKAITGIDLSRGDDRLMSYLALKIIDGLPSESRVTLETAPRSVRTVDPRARTVA